MEIVVEHHLTRNWRTGCLWACKHHISFGFLLFGKFIGILSCWLHNIVATPGMGCPSFPLISTVKFRHPCRCLTLNSFRCFFRCFNLLNSGLKSQICLRHCNQFISWSEGGRFGNVRCLSRAYDALITGVRFRRPRPVVEGGLDEMLLSI